MGNHHPQTHHGSNSYSRKRDFDAMVDGTGTHTSTHTDNTGNYHQDDMTTLEHDLNQVEQTLQEQPQNNSVFQWSGQSQRGRAVFESLGSALGSIRQRYQQLQSSMSTATTTTTTTNNNNNNSDSNINIHSSASSPLSLPTDFEGRLATAERAHSTRMPLGMIRQQQQQQHLASTQMNPAATEQETPTAASVASVASLHHDAKTEDDSCSDADGSSAASAGSSSSGKGSPSKRYRKPSTLVASRRYVEAQETHEIELHEQVALSPSPPQVESSSSSSPLLPTTLEKQQEPQPPAPLAQIESEDRPHTDIVLPFASLKKLDASKHHGHVLLPSTTTSDDIADPDQPVVPTIYCWGDSPHYSLSTTTTDSTTVSTTLQPTPLSTHARVGRSELVSISLGDVHAAFATTSGSLLICGNNTEGAVDPSQRQTPTISLPMHLESILALTPRILQVACGFDHTALITETRAVLTFGNNMDGQLGHRQPAQKAVTASTTTTTTTTTIDGAGRFQNPAAMVLPRRAAQVVCGHRFTAVLTTRMEVYVCGREEITGYNTLEGPPRLPEQNSALQGLPIVYIAAGEQHVVVLTAQGTAYAWGANPTGACGREFPKLLSVPVPIQVPQSSMEQPRQPNGRLPPTPFSNWAAWEVGSPNIITLAEDVAITDAACGKDFTILVTKTGRLLVAGSNQQQQLGIVEATQQCVVPVQCIDHPHHNQGASFVSAEAGTHHTVLLDNQGNVWTMGNGNPLSLVLEGQSIATIAAGGSVTIAIASKGESAQKQTSSVVTPGLEGLLDGILLEKEVSKQESAVQELANQTEELFRCPAVMNSVFLDPKEIDDLYAKLISAAGEQKYRQLVVSAMENGMMKGLDSIKTARLMYPEAVRCLLLYLQCPLFRKNDKDGERDVQFDVRGDAIQLLCETILGLPFEGYKALTAWSTSIYAKELFVPFLVKPLMDQLNSKIQTERTRAVPVIVGVLRWFQNVAERYPDDVDAKPEDFHSSGVAQLPIEALFEDLIRYKRSSKAERGVNFFLCGSPFLLSPSCKRNLLQIEHQMTMVHAAQSQGVTFDLARRQFLFNPYFVMAIDRQYLLQQTLQAVASAAPGELRKSLKIVFKGEDGVDAGGVTKEFFQLLVVQLFDINTGMWTSHYGDGIQTWFNADCTWNQDGYYLVGVLVGLAVYNSVILDVHFPQAVYRKLLGLPLGLEDMVDPEIQKGLKILLEYEGDDVEDVFCLTFEVTWNSLGMERKRELKPGGASLPVTSDNREEYVMLYVKWLLVDSIESQYNEFERGFLQVMEGSSLDLLRPEELELLVVGTPELDFEALQCNTEYEGGYDKDSPVVQNLWRFIKESDRETQLKFLKFSTGTNKAPIGGLGEMPFKVQRAGPDSMQLPTSHTCFNTLLVPDYGDNYEKLKERLGRAILECEGFGLQ